MDHAPAQLPHPANQSQFQLAEIAQLERAGVLEHFRKRSASRREGLAEATGSDVAARRAPRKNKDAASRGKEPAISCGNPNLQQGTNVVTARGRRRRGRGTMSARMVVTGCYAQDKIRTKTAENVFHEIFLNQADGISGPPYSQTRVPRTVFDKLTLPDTVRKQLSAGTPRGTKHIDMLADSTSKVTELVESQSLLSAGDLSSSMSLPSRQSGLVLTGAEGEVRSELRLSGSAYYIHPSPHLNLIEEMCTEGRTKLQQLCAKTVGMELNDISALGGNVAEILLSRLDFVARRPAQVEQPQSLTVNNPPSPDRFLGVASKMHNDANLKPTIPLHLMLDAKLGGLTDLRTMQAWDQPSRPGVDNLQDVLSYDDQSFLESEEVHDFPTTSQTELLIESGKFEAGSWEPTLHQYARMIDGEPTWSKSSPEDDNQHLLKSVENRVTSPHFEEKIPNLTEDTLEVHDWEGGSCFKLKATDDFDYQSPKDWLYDDQRCSKVDTQNKNDDISVDWEGGGKISRTFRSNSLPGDHVKDWGGSTYFCPPDPKFHDYMFPQDLDFEGATDSTSWPP